MIPKEVLKHIRKIQITTNRLVNDVFAGQYSSVFKGRGMEFNEVREYLPGDDIRNIDWNVTARYGHLFVKKFVEERELTIMLLVDMSASGKFGTVDKTKAEIVAEIASVLAFSAIKNNDKVGMVVFTDKIEKYVPPSKTTGHILRLIRDILFFKPRNTGTDLNMALEYFSNVVKKKAIVFLISDFITKDYEKVLKIVSRKHDVVAISITDPKEKELPANIGYVELADAETGETITIDTNDKKFIDEYNEFRHREEKERETFFSRINIDYINITTNISYIKPLLKFFYLRSRRFH
jgi:uncharacterized protein (DUF58 family)